MTATGFYWWATYLHLSHHPAMSSFFFLTPFSWWTAVGEITGDNLSVRTPAALSLTPITLRIHPLQTVTCCTGLVSHNPPGLFQPFGRSGEEEEKKGKKKKITASELSPRLSFYLHTPLKCCKLSEPHLCSSSRLKCSQLSKARCWKCILSLCLMKTYERSGQN